MNQTLEDFAARLAIYARDDEGHLEDLAQILLVRIAALEQRIEDQAERIADLERE